MKNFKHSKTVICSAVCAAVLASCSAGEEAEKNTSNTPTASNTNISLVASTLNINEGKVGERRTDNLKVRLSQSHSNNIIVGYETKDNTAIAGQRYQASSGSVNFSPCESILMELAFFCRQ